MILSGALIILCAVGVSTPPLPSNNVFASAACACHPRKNLDITTATHSSPTDTDTAGVPLPTLSPLLVDAGYGEPDEVDDPGRQEPTPSCTFYTVGDVYQNDLRAGNSSLD